MNDELRMSIYSAGVEQECRPPYECLPRLVDINAGATSTRVGRTSIRGCVPVHRRRYTGRLLICVHGFHARARLAVKVGLVATLPCARNSGPRLVEEAHRHFTRYFRTRRGVHAGFTSGEPHARVYRRNSATSSCRRSPPVIAKRRPASLAEKAAHILQTLRTPRLFAGASVVARRHRHRSTGP
jgi:hypothetical protein